MPVTKITPLIRNKNIGFKKPPLSRYIFFCSEQKLSYAPDCQEYTQYQWWIYHERPFLLDEKACANS
jgi:hypothetical protein